MEAVSALISIILIDLVLSGDNALVIGMAAHQLPPRQRRVAIAGGAGVAVALRIALTVVASFLLRVPYLQVLGGVLLLWIAFKLLREEGEDARHRDAPERMLDAMMTIVVADVVMSLDNILGVAGAARGNSLLLAIGLVFSMALVMFGGGLVALLLNAFRWLSYLATAVIAWTGADMVLRDHGLDARIDVPHAVEIAVPLVVAVSVVTFAHWFHRHRPARRRAAAGGAEPAVVGTQSPHPDPVPEGEGV